MVERGNDLNVRPASDADAAALAEMLNAIIRVGGTTALETLLGEAEFSAYFLHGDGFVACHVAENTSTGMLMGFQALGRNPDLPDGWVDIGTYARVAPKQAGVGTALFAATRAKAKERGFIAINATIRADNHGGLAYYEKMGFRTYDTLQAVPLNDGTPVDRIQKRCDLD